MTQETINAIIASGDSPEWRAELHKRTEAAQYHQCACLNHPTKWDQRCADADHKIPARTANKSSEELLS